MVSFALSFCILFSLPGQAFAGREVRLGPGRDHLRPVRYAEIEISGTIPERLPEIYVLRPALQTLEELVRRLNEAADDRQIDGLVVRLGRFGGGWAKAREVRGAISNVAGRGKEVTVFLEQGGNLEYYIATAADRVVMPPAGGLMFLGLRAEALFLRGLFDKVGITPDFIQVGNYKGASDPFMHETASEAFAESVGFLLDSLFKQFTGDIAEGRGVDRDAISRLIDGGPYTPSDALEAGLLDGIRFYDELLQDIESRADAPFQLVSDYGRERITAMPLGEGTQRLLKMMLGMRMDPDAEPYIPRGNVIAVLYAVGPVVMQIPETAMIDDSVIDARLTVRILEELQKEPNVKAIVLRVESPGGDAQASDMIWQAARRTDRVKPVITSISDMAGSGGYYIACGGRYIFASEGSLTGSIGVMGGKFVVKDLFDKLGLNVEVFQRGEHAGLFSPVEKFSDSQREKFHRLLEDTYNTFLKRVAESRGMSVEEAAAVADGRPFTGSQALDRNLIDAAGGLYDAVEHARKAAGIDEDEEIKLVFLPKSQSLLDAIFWGRDIGVSMPPLVGRRELERLLPDAASDGIQYINALSLLRDYQPAALMPAVVRVR